MTPTELKETRAELGLTAVQLARALRLGHLGDRTIRRWERGDSQIPGPAQVALEFMLHAHRLIRR